MQNVSMNTSREEVRRLHMDVEHAIEAQTLLRAEVERLTQENTSLRAEIEGLKDALRWYVQNDDVTLGDPDNQYWVDGYERAKALL